MSDVKDRVRFWTGVVLALIAFVPGLYLFMFSWIVGWAYEIARAGFLDAQDEARQILTSEKKP